MRINIIFATILIIQSLNISCGKTEVGKKQIPDFSQYTVTSLPDFAQNSVIYELYVRSFTPEGTFQAVEKRIPYLKKLGVDIIWFMPIYPIGEKGRKGKLGSPYAVKDFRAINPEFGDFNSYKHLVDELHKAGFKVILDFVPNHAANDNVLTGEHPEWFIKDQSGNFTREVADWSDVIDFNYSQPELQEYIIESMLYWIKSFGIDGFRCDVAGMVPYEFWEKAIPRLKAVKPDLYLLAEWEDPELLVKGFHSDYDWTLYDLLRNIRAGKARTSAAIEAIYRKESHYPKNALPLRFLENHDKQRSMKVFGVEAIDAYAKFLFTLPGIPLIYAGQEIGETHRPSLFEKDAIQWSQGDSALLELYTNLVRIRKSHPCFTHGNFQPLQVTMLDGALGAFFRESDECASIVLTNLRAESVNRWMVTIPDTLSAQWGNIPFVNVNDSSDAIQLTKNLSGKSFLPFTTKIYVARK